MRSSWFCLALGAAIVGLPTAAQAEDPDSDAGSGLSVTAKYIGDVTGVARGGVRRGADYLDNSEIVATGDLDRLLGWTGVQIQLHALSNQGGNPNARSGSIQGIDNIEVPNHRIKLYEAWLEQSFAANTVNVRLGLSDLNAEFYQNDGAGLLLASGFGMGSELAATGPNGPSIFPSTAMTARLRIAPTASSYVQAAIINAHAGVLGDQGGVHFKMDDGALLIGEVGWTGRGKIAAGYWRYTKRQAYYLEPVPPLPYGPKGQGGYLLVEQPLRSARGGAAGISAFVRIGFSDGKTTPYRGGWQAGALIGPVLADRPQSQLSLGLTRAQFSRSYRQMGMFRASETGLELTYSDALAGWASIQPDLQYILHPAGDRGIANALVLALRITLNFQAD